MLHLLLRSLSLSVHHVCRDDDDEFALLDAHDVPTRTRGKEGGGVLSLPTPPLLPPQLRQRKCIRNQTLPLPRLARVLYSTLHSPSLSFMEVILASIRKEAGPGYIVLCLSDIVTCDVQLV